MNIFALSSDPVRAAKQHCDIHVIKMLVEAAQLLCTCNYVRGTYKDWMYKPTHVNHPCSIWVRSSATNYLWLLELAEALADEFEFRFGHEHKTASVVKRLRARIRCDRTSNPTFCFCGPSELVRGTVIDSNRELYRMKSKKFSMVWTRRKVPAWMHSQTVGDQKCQLKTR